MEARIDPGTRPAALVAVAIFAFIASCRQVLGVGGVTFTGGAGGAGTTSSTGRGATATNSGPGGAEMATSSGSGGAASTSSTTSSSSGCATGMKVCNGMGCVPADVAHGCSATSCAACPGGANADAACDSNGQCAMQCHAGYADCDDNPSNGCETSTDTDTGNCGACGKQCPSSFSCDSGQCGCNGDDAACGNNGLCIASLGTEVCQCNGVTCPVGKRCAPNGGACQ